MPPTENDNERSGHRMRRVPPDGIRWLGRVRFFRALLYLQHAVLSGRIGGPRDGEARKPD